jgi:hypothetical protein
MTNVLGRLCTLQNIAGGREREDPEEAVGERAKDSLSQID